MKTSNIQVNKCYCLEYQSDFMKTEYTLNAEGFLQSSPSHMYEGTPFCCLCSPLNMATTSMNAVLPQIVEKIFYLVPNSQ